MSKLITELSESEISFISEAKDNSEKSYYISGIFAQGNQKNRNGRIYPTEILERQVIEYNELISKKRSLGELNHPATPSVNPERASHLITELYRSGNDFVGKAKILDTPVGKIVKVLLDEGITIGVSTRGLGTVVGRNGINEVQNDYKMTAIDIVADPSAPDAFVRGIMESKEWVFVDGRYVEQDIDRAKMIIQESKRSEHAMMQVFEDFMKKISIAK